MSETEGWRAPNTLLGAVGIGIGLLSLVISIFALVASCDAARSGDKQAAVAEQEAARRGLLELSNVSAYFTSLSGEESDVNTGTRKSDDLQGPLVDISLRNRGSGEALVTRISVQVMQSEHLEGCWPEGGPLKVAANYEIEIPIAKKPPFSTTKVMAPPFAVKPGENDRLAVTIGPDSKEVGMTPWVAVVTVRLHHIDGADLDVGPIALVDSGQDPHLQPSGMSWRIDRPVDPACMRQNALIVDSISRIPGITPSAEFAALRRALQGFRT
ncbi:hypothetical protein ACQP1V_09475 [Microtetraspora malaysiensis]|uniref:hypothetical protein n=1 Tax=Microtetraspora malaysiensis TaxID=161358 RepID=UPI003D8B4362